MKKLFLALLAIIPLGLSAQQSGFDQLIKKYESREGVVSMNLQGNILDGLKNFMSSYYDAKSSYDYDYDSYSYDDDDDYGNEEYEIIVIEEDDDSVGVAPNVIEEETVAESAEYEPEVTASEGEDDEDDEDDYDYDYDYDDYDYDYSYNYGSSWDDYLDMFKTYLEGLTYVKAVMYENPNKKFEKDIKRLVISKKPYRSTFSMRDDTDDIRFYMIDDDGSGNCEMLMIVGDRHRYVAVNILGTVDFSGLVNMLMKYM